MTQAMQCSVEGCEKPVQALVYCAMHYQRQRIHGDTAYTKPQESAAATALRFWSKIEKTASCWLWMAGKDHAGYGVFSLRGKDFKAHRFAYELAVGPIPDGKFLDHICHTPACVRPYHLRLATKKQNAENRSGPNRNGKSGIRGVSLHRPSGKWKGQVTHNGTRYAKYFATPEEAAAFAQAKRQELFTHTIEKRPLCKQPS